MYFNQKYIYAVLLIALAASGCATSEKIQPTQVGDNRLTCKELEDQLAQLDQSQKNIEDNKGVTGTNVAAALFWLPGLAYTYYDAGQAENLVQERRSQLTSLYNKKDCP
ncbi:MAG TPA: hypothetical protein VHL31_00795, partial [Geminicoccus sp.]|jgi:hypothetical protein|uniref:hypothetical protein n=1 Tax=Geminicoccus sp. TaxID=2024832 RepID=UPI002E2EF219